METAKGTTKTANTNPRGIPAAFFVVSLHHQQTVTNLGKCRRIYERSRIS
jgi:hypothetical protein